MTDNAGNTCAYHYAHNKFHKNQSLHSPYRSKGLGFVDEQVPTSIHTYRKHENENLKWSYQHSWQPTKNAVCQEILFA